MSTVLDSNKRTLNSSISPEDLRAFCPMLASPANAAPRITNVTDDGEGKENQSYFNNEANPWPDPVHGKDVGGLPFFSDMLLLQKQQIFNRGKNLEPMVNPRRSGALGTFTCVKAFIHKDKETPIFIYFSAVTYGKEFPDSGYSPRAFAIEHYTEEGSYDLVGLNWPVSFCRDSIQSSDAIRSQQRNPASFFLGYDNNLFDFLADFLESNDTWLMHFSYYEALKGWRFQHGYGTYTCIYNVNVKFVYFVKCHYTADYRQEQMTWPKVVRISGEFSLSLFKVFQNPRILNTSSICEDPGHIKPDPSETFEPGDRPTWIWTLKVQIMINFDHFDVTKIWPQKLFPMQKVDKLVVHTNSENYYYRDDDDDDEDVEQAAFSPSSLVPGIQDSPDHLLQFQMFSFYRNAQDYSIRVNLRQIPVNSYPLISKSYSPLACDGPLALRSDANTVETRHYQLTSFRDLPSEFSPDAAEDTYAVSDTVFPRVSHFWSEGTLGEYDQARELYRRVMTDQTRRDQYYNSAAMLKFVGPQAIQENFLSQLYCITPECVHSVYKL